MYPIDQCIAFNKDESQHFRWLLHDRAYLHSVLLMALSIDDLMQRRQPTAMTRFHLHKTIVLLNDELKRDAELLSDSNVYIIMALAMAAGVFGDHSAIDAHLSGLQQLLWLRGGPQAFHPKTLFKIDQIELFRYLNNGSRPHISRPISWNPCYNIRCKRGLRVDGFIDPRIAAVYDDLQHLAELINEHAGQTLRLDGSDFQKAMRSIQLRLLNLGSCEDGSISEMLLVGMLAFLSTAFRLPGEKLPYSYIAKRMRRVVDAIEPSTPLMTDLQFWCLMVGSISVLDACEPWIQAKWQTIPGPARVSWDLARQRLRNVMWINCVHDTIGYKAYLKLPTGG